VPGNAVFAGVYDGLVSFLGLVLSDRKLADSKVQEVEPHVSVTFLLCFKGVGVPCFGVLPFEPHVVEPCLESLLASLYAFPGIVEYHEVVGISDAACCVPDYPSVFPLFFRPTGFFHYVFEAVKRNVG